MEGYRDMPIDEMVQIEDKDDLTNSPIPNRSYKIPRALLPSLEKFIVEMKNSGWIEDSTSDFVAQFSLFRRANHMKTKATAS